MAARDALALSSIPEELYEFEETKALVELVKDAAELIRAKGEAAFPDLRTPGSRWRRGESYIFVCDSEGEMLVHPDPALEGKNQLDLMDIKGKPIIRGMLSAVTSSPSKPEGWYHYQWPVPGGLLPRWKSSHVKLVTAPSGKRLMVGCGVYNDRMEKVFAIDMVMSAVALIEREGAAAFEAFRDPKSSFWSKDAYIFVYEMDGTNLVFPPFPNLEGRNLIDWKDPTGTLLVREIVKTAQSGSGWVDYIAPKPGESFSTRKTSFVCRAKLRDRWLAVGCGVYLEDAPKLAAVGKVMRPQELMSLVREGAALLEREGEKAYPELRRQGGKWYHDDVYCFVWTTHGTRILHPPAPEIEGRNATSNTDILGRPYGKMILEAAEGPAGEGWVHYMYPEPDNIFPTWKSTFVKRVNYPSGQKRIIGSGAYNMQMDETLIEDVVERAAVLVEKQGRAAFDRLRDKSGPFVFMDIYVFVTAPDGRELENAGFPSLEGHNLLDLKDLKGKSLVREEIDIAMKQGRGWVDAYWYAPGRNTEALKRTYVRKVVSGGETFIVGSGFYLKEK